MTSVFVQAIRIFTVISGLTICIGYGFASESSQQKGLRLANELKQRDIGWGDSKSHLSMILRNASGQEARRELRVWSFEMVRDGDKSITLFDSPRDVAGTAFLNFSHARKPDQQWIYLPALRKVRRIATKNKSGPFMGSEFAFEDMTSFEVEKFDYDFIRDDIVDGEACWVIEQVPKDTFSGYTRQIMWLDMSEYRIRKIEYFDRRNAPLKTLTLSDFRKYEGRYWRPHFSEMINIQTGKSTKLLVSKLMFKTGLLESDFDKNKLGRLR